MSGLFLGGLVSGMDTESVIRKLMDVEAAKTRKHENRKAQIEARQEAWRSVQTSLSTLRTKLDSIRLSSLYSARKATLSDDKVASVSVSSGAAAVTHDLRVAKLAQTHVVGGGAFNSANQALGVSGTLTVGTGSVQVDATDTLNSLRDKINANASSGVKADVVTILQGSQSLYRLVLTAKQPGSAGAINLAGTEGILSNNETVATVTPAMTDVGPYRIEVTRAAEAPFLTRDSAVLTGSHSYAGTFTLNGTQITVVPGADPKQDFVDAINGSGAGVTATLVSDGVQEQIRLTSASPIVVNADDGTLESLGLVVPATYTVNGTEYKGYADPVSNAAGVAGLEVHLTQTGEARVGGLLQVLGFHTGTGLNTISLAQDAEFTLNGMDYRTSTNAVQDVLPGVTFTLRAEGNTVITVGQDNDRTVSAVKEWVEAVNSSMQLLRDYTRWDITTKTGGVLHGDHLARSVQTSLRSMLSYTVTGSASGISQLSHVGIETGAYGTADYGKLTLNEAKLKEKLAADADSVAMVFGARRENVSRTASVTVSSGETTKSDLNNGDTDINRAGTPGGGWTGTGVADGDPAQQVTLTFAAARRIDQVALTIPDTDGTTGLKDYTLSYMDTGGVWRNIESVTGHVGSTRRFEFAPVTATAFRLEIAATHGGTPARVTELEVRAETLGIASTMYGFVNGALATRTGTLATRQSTYDTQIKDISSQIERMSQKMADQERVLRRQFTRMEQMLSRLQEQGGALLAQINGLTSQNKK